MWKRLELSLLATVAILTTASAIGHASAQDARAEWDKTVAAAKGSKLNLVVQPHEGFDAIAAAFQKKFPDIHVVVTSVQPSAFAPRLITEQKNNLFAWDVWWSTASNMNHVAIPANALEKIDAYLVLPEVKDPSNWYNTKYLYTSDRGPYVFTHTHFTSTLAIYNTDLTRKDITEPRDLLDSTFTGKIALRVPDRPHGGTEMLAQGLLMTDEAWLRALLVNQKPILVDNARQVTDGVIRGDYAIGIGTDEPVLQECRKAGGCANIKPVPFAFVTSRGLSVPKNPPNPAAVKVFVNWLLNKEGQEVYVREWAKFDTVGAHSMRRDVAPNPKHLNSMPDFNKLDQYMASSFDSGWRYLSRVTEVFNQTRAK